MPSAESAPAVIEAVVQTASTETVFRRAGRGAHALLLLVDSGSAELEYALFDALARDFRVIAPRFRAREDGGVLSGDGAGSVAISRWLRDLIDGLGLERPSIVAEERLGVAALGFALLDPERIDRLVMICRDPADLALQHEALDDMLASSGHPLLVLRLKAAAEQELLPATARRVLRRFLTGSDGAREAAAAKDY